MTFSEPKLPPIPLTAPIQRFNPSHHQKHGHSQSSHQLGSPSLLFKPSISENTLLPFPKFPNTEANTSTITTTTPQLPPSHPLQITSSSEGRGMVHNEARLTPTAAVETAPSTSTNLPSNFLSHRRATISQGIDTTSSSALPFSGYATVPPRRGFPLTASGTAASTATSLGSSNPPLHNRQRSMQLPPPLASSSKQRHHIPPPAMQAHLHSAPIFGSSSSGTYSMHTQPSTITSTQYYSPPRQAGSSREILTGNQLQIPSAAGPIQQQEQQLQSLNHPATRELILNMFEQFYDSLVLDNLEQQDQKMNLLKEELGDYLLSRIESKFNQDSEIEIFKRSEWENKMDKRFEDFRKTLSSELLFLEKRIDSIEKIHRRIGPNTSRRRGDDGTHNMIMDPSGSLNIGTTSRKRSAEEMEEDDSDYYEEDPYSSTTSNTTMTNTSSGGDGKGKGKTKGKGKRRFTTPPELVNLTKRVEVLEAHASSSSSASASVSPRQGDTTVTGPSTTSHHQHHQSETAYTTTFRPISSLRGT